MFGVAVGATAAGLLDDNENSDSSRLQKIKDNLTQARNNVVTGADKSQASLNAHVDAITDGDLTNVAQNQDILNELNAQLTQGTHADGSSVYLTQGTVNDQGQEVKGQANVDKGHTYLNIDYIDTTLETLNHEIAHHNGLGETSATVMGKISDFAYNIGTSLNQKDINTHRQAITPTAQTLQSLSTDEQLAITQDNQALLETNEAQRVEEVESGDGLEDKTTVGQIAQNRYKYCAAQGVSRENCYSYIRQQNLDNLGTAVEDFMVLASVYRGGGIKHTKTKSKTQPKQSATTQTKATQPKPAPKCSFHGSTLISTANGYKPISAIEIGDFVWSRDEYTGKYSYQPVTNWYHNQYQETVYVTIVDSQGNEQILISNAIHPFFAKVPYDTIVPVSSEGHDYQGEIDNGVWIDASNLQAGYQLLSEDGTWQTVKSVSIAKEALTAYNLTVDNTHTYFVSAQSGKYGVWVHNDCFNGIKLPVSGARDILSKGPHLHTSYGEVIIQGVAGTGKLKVKLFGSGDLNKATKQIKENWSNPDFRIAFRARLIDMKTNLPNLTTDQRYISNTTANIDAVIKATKSSKFPEFIQ